MNSQIKAVMQAFPADSRDRSDVTGWLLFMGCVAGWLLTLSGILLLPLSVSWVAAILNGISIAMLFIVGHDAAHGSLVHSWLANRVIATLAFLPALHPLSGWIRSHNQLHHAWTNLKGVDPGYAPFSFDEYQKLSPARRLLERCYRSALGLGLFYFVEVYWKSMVFPRREHGPVNRGQFLLDRLWVAAFLATECALIYWAALVMERAYPVLFTVYAVAVPVGVFSWLSGFVTYQHHTNAAIPWFDRKEDWSFFQNQVAGSTHIQFPRVFNLLLMDIHEHTAHHADPRIPLYHLHESQLQLEAAYPESVKVIGWTPGVWWKTLNCCQLYDYREHRWLDFQGRPTTGRLVADVEPFDDSRAAHPDHGKDHRVRDSRAMSESVSLRRVP